MEPTVIWRKTQVIPSVANGEWNAGYAQTELAPKAAYKNSNYKEGVGYVDNYKKTADTTYDSKVVLNNFKPMIPEQFHQVWQKGIESNEATIEVTSE